MQAAGDIIVEHRYQYPKVTELRPDRRDSSRPRRLISQRELVAGSLIRYAKAEKDKGR